LIEWLKNLDDDEIISYLKIVKNSKESNSDWWDDLTDDQKLAVQRGLDDIDNGRITPHNEITQKYGL